MKWSETLTFRQPLRDVQLRTPGSQPDIEARIRAAEQAAYERGRNDGEKALSELLLQQRGELLELQQGVLKSLNQAVPQVVQQSEGALIQVALECARKMVAAMPVTSELVEACVREAVGQVEDSAEITVQLHPEDLALLRKHQSPILQGLPETGPLRFVNSNDVTRGGCLVQTRFGLLDARRETKFEQLQESLNS